MSKSRDWKTLFPPISVNNQHIVPDSKLFQKEAEKSDIPLIPPPKIAEEIHLPPDPEIIPQWFVVVGSGNERKPDGPFSVPQLRDMYKSGYITDSSLLWHEGDKNWTQLLYNRYLRPKLLLMPIVPVHVLTSSTDGKALFDPIPQIPSSIQTKNCEPLACFETSSYCSRCGAFSHAHMKGVGEQIPDLSVLRQESKLLTPNATEVLPGFLWIGNQASSRSTNLVTLGITLSINCTKNLAGPDSSPPVFRCSRVGLKEKPSSEQPKDIQALFDIYTTAYDLIELERIMPERAVESDPIAPVYRGPTDQYGRPINRPVEEGTIVIKKSEFKKHPPSRVLLWSRLGLDRACVFAIGYLIRRFGVTLERASNIIETARPGMSISPAYLYGLQKWSEKYTLGSRICQDCMDQASNHDNGLREKLKKEDESIYGVVQKRLSTKYEKLIKPESYLKKVLLGYHISSPWSGLMDLSLRGCKLGEDACIDLFKALSHVGLAMKLHLIDLSGNDLGHYSVGAICDGLGLEEDECSSELVRMDLSHNLIDDDGAKVISQFLKKCQSVTSLDLSHNPLSDDGGAFIFSVISRPISDMFEDDGYDDGRDGNVEYNMSLIDLNLANTQLGHESAEVLTENIKYNSTLTRLDIGMNPHLEARDLKHILTSIRVQNSTLCHLILSYVELSLKSAVYMSRVVEGQRNGIRALDFTHCKLLSSHLSSMASHLTQGKNLIHLNLSSNPLGCEGGKLLADILSGKKDKEKNNNSSSDYEELSSYGGSSSSSSISIPPLEYLDISCCELTPECCQSIFVALMKKPSLTYLDISTNNVGIEFGHYLKDNVVFCKWNCLKMNRCHLQSQGAAALFQMLRFCQLGYLGATLKQLYLAENDIGDTAVFALQEMLSHNNILEVLDLGFNRLTNQNKAILEVSTEVTSKSEPERKLLELQVNLIGNEMDSLALGYPMRVRSKQLLCYGVHPSQGDLYNEGYSHLPGASRPHYLAKKETSNNYELIRFPPRILS